MHKKYVLKHDPSKEMTKFMAKHGIDTTTISKDGSSIVEHVGGGTGGQFGDLHEDFCDPRMLELLQYRCTTFADFFQRLEEQGKEPYVVVSY